MLNNRGDRIHLVHKPVLMMQEDPFFCNSCRQIGFGSAYGCESCSVLFHTKCMYPPSMVSHPLQKNCILKYYRQAETSGASTFCSACSKPLHGDTYSSAASGNPRFHPSCLHLEKCITVDDVKLNLVAACPSACNWCQKTSTCRNKVPIPSWWYVSEDAKRRFHVGCVSEIMVEFWKSGGIPYDEDADDGQTSIRADKPCQWKGKKRGFFRRKVVSFSFVAVWSALTGDVTRLSGRLLWNVPKLFGPSRYVK